MWYRSTEVERCSDLMGVKLRKLRFDVKHAVAVIDLREVTHF